MGRFSDALTAASLGEWYELLEQEFRKPYFAELAAFLDAEYAQGDVFPPARDVFAALRLTGYSHVKAVILGQDPYHGAGQAHGLAFSVADGVKIPPSLRNIYKELHADCGGSIPESGNLTRWAEQGVLLLNAVLTVRSGEPNSHSGKGWEQFTDRVIALLAERGGVAFVLWGAYARKKAALIAANEGVSPGTDNAVIEGAHPSPLSARKFFGGRYFSRVNDFLRERGVAEIEWNAPEELSLY